MKHYRNLTIINHCTLFSEIYSVNYYNDIYGVAKKISITGLSCANVDRF